MTRKKTSGSETSATTKTVRASRSKKNTSSNTSEGLPYQSINEVLDNRVRLKCKNVKQKSFSKLIDDKEVIFAYGPAGTGKSYTAIAKGIELLQANPDKYTSLKIVKPIVDSDESYGFLPGSLKEKLEPYLASSFDIIDKIIGPSNRRILETMNVIIVEPLGFLRGKTLDNTILIVEEAQNMTPKQMKNVLTRIGENSKFIISGDLDQSDRYRDVTKSGLYDALKKFRKIEECGFLEFETSEIVRHPLISKFLKEYKEEDEAIEQSVKIDRNQVIKTEPIVIKENFKEKKSWFSKFFKW